MHGTPHILHLEDSATDAEIIKDHLREEGVACVIQRVQTREAFVTALNVFNPDLVLADYSLPNFDGLSALRIARKVAPGVPVIMVTGAMTDEAVAGLLQEGAADYVIKDRLARLGAAVRSALDRAQELVRIRRLGELRQVLSDVNHAMVHASAADTLFQAICEIVIKNTSLLLAWIGTVNPAGTISRSAAAGTSTGLSYMTQIAACLAGQEANCPPATIAVRERRVVLISNAADSDSRALAAGTVREASIVAEVAIPLCEKGNVVGVLAFASGSPDFFDDEILKLLEEIGQEISYCLEALNERQRRSQAEQRLQESVSRLKRAMIGTINVIGAIVEARDPYTSGHEHRVGELAAAIGAEMGLDSSHTEVLRIAGYVHDVGKISTPAEYLSKPGKLSKDEFNLIKEHAEQGYQILKGVEFDGPIALVARQHHERIDGSGYPQGLKNGEIILEARIVAVADVIEAMSSHRPYRASLSIDAALAEISAGAGVRYDRDVAAACMRLFREKNYRMPV